MRGNLGEDSTNGEVTPVVTRPSDVRRILLKHSWRQGSVLSPGLAAEVVSWLGSDRVNANSELPSDAWYVVVAQDCDVVYGNLITEPVVEVILARAIPRVEAPKARLRDPRELHVELRRSNGTAQPVAVHVRNRGALPRELLLQHEPSTEMVADELTTLYISQFIARRYSRESRPEEFERRLGPAKKKLERLLAREVRIVRDIYFSLKPHGELVADDSYLAKIYIILQDDFADLPPPEQAGPRKNLRNEVRRATSECSGIEFDEPFVASRYDISIREMDALLPMDLGWTEFLDEPSQHD